MIDPPYFTTTDEHATAVVRLTIPRAEIQSAMGPAIGEVMAAIEAQGLLPAGAVFSHHLRMDPEVFDFEVGVPIVGPFAAAGRVVPGSLPSTRVARTQYHGSYEGLGDAWGQLTAWLAEHEHTPGDDLWEMYLTGPESGDDPAHWRTELNLPVRK